MRIMKHHQRHWAIGCAVFGLFLSMNGWAGVQNLHHFMDPGEWSLGVEPEMSFTRGAQSSVSAKFTHGLNDMMNLQAQAGAGTPERRIRLGGAATFDFFPDLPGQPGIGVALQGAFLDRLSGAAGEFTVLPYLHKRFDSKKSSVDPFVSMPVGVRVSEKGSELLLSLAVGALFEVSHSFLVSSELGIAANNTDSYFAVGMVYLHE